MLTKQPSNPVFDLLNQTLVLSVRKSYWASSECEIFPNRIYTKRIISGPGKLGNQSRNPINNLSVIIEGLIYSFRKKPKLIVIGSASRASAWFSRFKKWGLLRGIKLLAITQSYMNDNQAQYFDKIIVYSHRESNIHSSALSKKYEFAYLPVDGNFTELQPKTGKYIFAGGGAGRDFPSFIEAVKNIQIPVIITTFSKQSLNYEQDIPTNCKIYWKMPVQQFLEIMANSMFVVNPLTPGMQSHGQTTVVQAIRLGKAIISTSEASVDDYIKDSYNGILVQPRDISGYQNAIIDLATNKAKRERFEQNTMKIAPNLTYSTFSEKLIGVCNELIEHP